MVTLRTVVSSVAKSLFSANTSLLLSRVINVDFPTLVYPTNATRTSFPRFLRWTLFCLSISFNSCFRREILSRMIRRSVSNWVSPGPRMMVPPPPRCRSRCVHIRVSRGNRYWYCASSTCALACAVCARMANISRIRLVRSIMRILSSFSILRSWRAESSSSKMITSISCSFPVPTNVAVLGVSNRCTKRFTGASPAVSARKASSSRYSFTFSSF